MNTQIKQESSAPRRPTVQYFARQLVQLASRRGHTLDSLLQAVRVEYGKLQT